jgi:hypothetical protein
LTVVDVRPLVAAGSQYRYQKRLARWTSIARLAPRVQHHFWWGLHNVVAHPLVGVRPNTLTIWFHDWTSQRLNLERKLRPSPGPTMTSRNKWILHNVASHIAIGLVPCAVTFAWHDKTAHDMGEPYWV